MTWIGEHLDGIMALLTGVVVLISWFVRLEMKVKSLTESFRACQEERQRIMVRYDNEKASLNSSVHELGEKLHSTLIKIIERMARVETKLDRLNGGEQ